MLVFFGFTPYIRVWAHWVITYQFAAIIGSAWMISENAMATRRLLISLWVFDALLVVLLLFSSSMLLPRQEAYEHNRLLVKQYAAIPLKDVIITPYIGSSSQLAFYTHRQTYMAQGVLKVEDNGFGRKQYELWGSPKLSKGSNIIFYGPADAVTREKLKKLFQRIEVRTDLKLSVIESYLDELVPYYCYGLLNADRVL